LDGDSIAIVIVACMVQKNSKLDFDRKLAVRSKDGMGFNHFNQFVKDNGIDLEFLAEVVNVIVKSPFVKKM
jgi:hypothetical protein